MRRFNEENERVKRDYMTYLKDAEGYDEATIYKVSASLVSFEEALGFKPFKRFHRDWASTFKSQLAKRRNGRTGQPLGLSTRDGILRDVRGFFHWLASQHGYKSRITYADVRYFNNNAKDARAAHAQRPKRYPSMRQCLHAFGLMPTETRVNRRDRALFALWVMTGARSKALSTLRLKHVDLVEGLIFQDGREVATKGAKTFETWFFPVDPTYREALESWTRELFEELLFGPGDALFPRQKCGHLNNQFVAVGLDPEPYSNAQIVSKVVGDAFVHAGIHRFNPHSIRTTLALFGDQICTTMEARKAWSQNLGHENLATTVSAYMPVGRERQGELIKGHRTTGMTGSLPPSDMIRGSKTYGKKPSLFVLINVQMASLEPCFPKSRGKLHIDDRQVLEGISCLVAIAYVGAVRPRTVVHRICSALVLDFGVTCKRCPDFGGV